MSVLTCQLFFQVSFPSNNGAQTVLFALEKGLAGVGASKALRPIYLTCVLRKVNILVRLFSLEVLLVYKLFI